MKFSIRFCLLFCCLVLLFTCFSVPAKAEETETNYFVLQQVGICNEWQCYETPVFRFYPGNETTEALEFYKPGTYAVPHDTTYYSFISHYTVRKKDGTALFKGGRSAKVDLYRANINFLVYQGEQATMQNAFYARSVQRVRALVEFSDGEYQYFDDVSKSQSDNLWNFSFQIDDQRDVISVEFITWTQGDTPNSNANWYACTYMGEVRGDDTYGFSVEQESEEAGLLGDISQSVTNGFDKVGGWFSNLTDGITDGFNKVGGWFSDLGDGIRDIYYSVTELPALIWDFIENGLKSLFVPDEEYMVSYKDKWESLLADRLGAVYQVVQITFGAWEDIGAADKTDTINIPVVTIPLLDGQEFSFGGYDVKIVPDGFGYLVAALKSIVGIVCTIMFINGLRKRYDEIMGVEQ